VGWAEKRTSKNFTHLTESAGQNAGFLRTNIPKNTLQKKEEKKDKKMKKKKA